MNEPVDESEPDSADWTYVLDNQNLLPALTKLGEYLDARQTHFESYVVGGAALLINHERQGYTSDVDSAAQYRDGQWTSDPELPALVAAAAADVAAELDVDPDWFNIAPSWLYDMGLPDGWLDRANTINFAGGLTLHIAHRQDIICYKTLALVDSHPYGRNKDWEHLADIRPTNDELAFARQWINASAHPDQAIVEHVFDQLSAPPRDQVHIGEFHDRMQTERSTSAEPTEIRETDFEIDKSSET